MVAVGDRVTADDGNNFLRGIMGSGTATIPSGANAVNQTVSFGKTFQSPPQVIASATTGVNIDVNVRDSPAVTTTGFTARAFKTDGTNTSASTPVPFTWIAVGI